MKRNVRKVMEIVEEVKIDYNYKFSSLTTTTSPLHYIPVAIYVLYDVN